MFYIIGVFRRTTLWAMLLIILESIPEILYMLVIFGAVYLLLVLIHLLACKIGKNSRSAGESYVSALDHCYMGNSYILHNEYDLRTEGKYAL